MATGPVSVLNIRSHFVAKKLIGLTGPSQFTAYCVKMIEERLNANFVLLYQENHDNVAEWMERVDGLVLAGGVDIHPSLYGGDVLGDSGFSKFDFVRDMREIFALDLAFQRSLPTLGICRGHQMMGVYKGLGRLFVRDIDGSVAHQPSRHNINTAQIEPTHAVYFTDRSLFAPPPVNERKLFQRVLKEKTGANSDFGFVNSFHHQGLTYHQEIDAVLREENKIGVFAIANTGGEDPEVVIEGMCGIGNENFWASVQWHPEYDYESNSISAAIVDGFGRLVERKPFRLAD